MTGSTGEARGQGPVRVVDVLVVGGGQAALAAGYYLQRVRRDQMASLSFALLDAGVGPGGAWHGGWDSLQLFSPAGFSSLPGWPMPPWRGHGNPSGDHVQRYLSDYETRYRLPIDRPVRVVSVTRARQGTGFEVVTDRGPWRCRVLINATGSWGRPWWPSYPGMADFAGRQLHTADYRSAADFDGDDVLVVGGGNSGAQITADLSTRHDGSTTWLTQRPPTFLPEDVDGRRLFELATARLRAVPVGGSVPVAGPAGGAQGVTGRGADALGDIVMVPSVLAARHGGVLEAGPVFDRVTTSGVAWDEAARELAVDVIIWCTGFRPELEHLRMLSLTRRGGLPVTDPELASRSVDAAGVFFLGYGDWCGPASATLIGVGATARATVDAAVGIIQT